jgi:hypothetical protein
VCLCVSNELYVCLAPESVILTTTAVVVRISTLVEQQPIVP